MNKPLRGALFAAILLGGLGACNLDYFDGDKFAGGSYRPTVAVPLVNVNITVADLLKSYDNNIVLTEEPSDTGDRSFLTLIFSDTLDPISLDAYAVGGAVPAGVTIPLPIEKVDLRIFGNFTGDSEAKFYLTNPSVTFDIDNTTAASYELEFRDGLNSDFYTQKVNSSEKNYLEIIDPDHPYPIAASDVYSFTFNNDNLQYPDSPSEPAMTRVIEPTPKFLYYGANLTTTNTTTDLSGDVGVVANVFLPLEGYAWATRTDTSKYEFITTDTGGVELNFAEIRLAISNGLPLSGTIESIQIIDTTQTPWIKMMDLDLSFVESNLDPGVSTDGLLIPGAEGGNQNNDWVYTPKEIVNDIIITNSTEPADMVQPVIYGTNTLYGEPMSQIEALGQGNKVMLSIDLKTSEYNNDVKLYTDQSMNIKVGIRAQANANLGSALN